MGLAAPARAAIADGPANNGELFLVIQDATAQISYTLDMGVRMNDFFVLAQQDEGVQRFWGVSPTIDLNLQSFLTQTNPANYVWAVMAIDSFGPAQSNNQRLFTTARQGEEGNISRTISTSLRSGIGNTSFANFLNTVNESGTHGGRPLDFSINGSSVNNISEPGAGYFGEGGGTGPRLQGGALPFDVTNPLGSSSWFYQIGSTATVGPASVDEFDNIGAGSAGDGYFGFTFVDPNQNPTSPYASQWLLSYTLRPAFPQGQAVTALGRERSSVTEYLAGSASRWVAAPQGEFADYVMPNISPVPEPGGWLLFGAGALGLALGRRGVRGARRVSDTAAHCQS